MQTQPDLSENKYSLLGPFSQLLPMSNLDLRGPVADQSLQPIPDAGILIKDNRIEAVANFSSLQVKAKEVKARIYSLQQPAVCLPGFIDSHTHSCFTGSRASDYALRNSGSSYQEIAAAGGGIWDTVTQTRKVSEAFLANRLESQCDRFLSRGITTLEVKSGYGLSTAEELKMLRAINSIDKTHASDLIPTCLAAHTLPRDFKGNSTAYLRNILEELLPQILSEKLSTRLDAFVEAGAFGPEEIITYFKKAKSMGFSLTVHADQFTVGGSQVAIECGALSADHLEASGPDEIKALARSNVIATALPGATLGLGCGFTPARALLDAGACLAIASDFNPGSAPMGDLLTQASLLGAFEKITNAEVLSGITFRAAAALNLKDRGKIMTGLLADLVIFPTDNFNEILYQQGQMQPIAVWKSGQLVFSKDN
ncbi:imidazolonepropionase [Robiginitalea sp. IMCC43444]|uniref:imidazolonepropionase n=1 Tax=Robiginitalea sp. IMCC43444 TaxID=3459121 RepID=UPI004043061B